MNKDDNLSSKQLLEKISSLDKSNILLEKKLNSIYKLTEAINKNFTSEAIIQILHYSLNFLLNIENAVFIVKTKKKEWNVLLNYGKDFQIEKYNIENELSHYKEAQIIDLKDKNVDFYEFIIPTFHKEEFLGALLISGVKDELVQCTQGKFCYISTLANLTVLALENKRLFRQIKGNKKKQKDLETAKQIQKQLIPSVFPSSVYYEFHGNYIPFDEVGGDYYDVIKIDDDNVAFCIADVSGKGISAGMLMSNFQASIRILLTKKIKLKDLITSINKTYISATKQLRFVSLFVGMYNVKTRKLEFINAGHNYPVLKNGDKITTLETGCSLIGIFKELPFVESETVILEKEALLVMYTDGFSEIENELKEEFGIDNIVKTLLKHQNEPLHSINSNFMKALYDFKETQKIFDDISLLCAKFK